MSEASPTLTSTIEIEIPVRGDIYTCVCVSWNMCGTVLRASAMYCLGVAECSGGTGNDLLHSQTPYLKMLLGTGSGYALERTIEKQNKLEKEKKQGQREKSSMTSAKEKVAGWRQEVQDLAVLKHIKRAAVSDEKEQLE